MQSFNSEAIIYKCTNTDTELLRGGMTCANHGDEWGTHWRWVGTSVLVGWMRWNTQELTWPSLLCVSNVTYNADKKILCHSCFNEQLL